MLVQNIGLLSLCQVKLRKLRPVQRRRGQPLLASPFTLLVEQTGFEPATYTLRRPNRKIDNPFIPGLSYFFPFCANCTAILIA